MFRLADPSRELLSGLMALKNGFIDQTQLFAALEKCKLTAGESLVETLVRDGSLTRDQRGLVESSVAIRFKNEGDSQRTLASMPARADTHDSLDHRSRSSPAEITTASAETTAAPPGLETTARPCGISVTLPAPAGAIGDSEARFSIGRDYRPESRYRLVRLHARGGLGEVYVAHDQELKREVALKKMRDRAAVDPTGRSRFIVEAEVTGGLEHPGIVPVYSLGTDAHGLPFYAMRFIRGETLGDAIEHHHQPAEVNPGSGTFALSLQRLLRQFIDVCNAIDYAHGRGVLHRDIKPANIVVGKHGETLVVDWGLAKAVGGIGAAIENEAPIKFSASGSSVETLEGSALGTPAYMSPEQAHGNLDLLGPASDVYSLGATLYCILTGSPPFVGDDALDVLVKARKGEFPPPRQVDRSIPPALEAVVLRAMSFEPANRYQTARALADDVERYMADQPVSARPEPLWERLGRSMRRHRTVMSTAAAGLIASLIGLAAVATVQTRANASLTSANALLSAANSREKERFQLALDAIKTFHTGVSEDLLLKEKQFLKLRKSLLSRASEFYGKLGEMLKDQSDDHSRGALALAYGELASLTRTIGSVSNALELADKALALQRTLVARPGAHAGMMHTLLDLFIIKGRLQQATDDYVGARKTLQEGVTMGEALAKTAASRDVYRSLARCYQRLASNDADLSRPEDALTANARAIEILNKLVAESPGDLPLKNTLANTHFNVGFLRAVYLSKEADAVEALELARALEKSNRAADPPNEEYSRVLAEIDGMLGSVRLAQGNTDAALATLLEGRSTIEKLVVAEPNITLFETIHADVLGNLSLVYAKQGNLQAAIDAQRTSSNILGKLVQADPGDNSQRRRWGGSFNNIGDLELASEKVAEALASYTRAKELIEPIVKAQPKAQHYEFGLAFSLAGMGRAHARLGSFSQAASELRAASSIWERVSLATLESRYMNAGCHAVLAGLGKVPGSGVSAEDAENEAKLAIKAVKGPMEAGYRSLSELRADRDFRALNGRPDFEAMIKSLAAPSKNGPATAR